MNEIKLFFSKLYRIISANPFFIKIGRFFNKQKWFKALRRFLTLLSEHSSDTYYGGFAAGLAFFFLFSLIPVIMILTRISMQFPKVTDLLESLIRNNLPDEAAQILLPRMTAAPSSGMSIVIIAITFWIASRGFNSLIRVSQHAYGYEVRPVIYLYENFKAIGLTLITIIMIIFGLVVLIYGKLLGLLLTDVMAENLSIDISFWYFFRWPISFFIFLTILVYLYSTSANLKKRKRLSVLPGAIFSTFGILISTSLYSAYVVESARNVNYNLIFGSFSNIAVMMIWLYYISYVILIGILINVTYKQYRENPV